LNVNLKESVAQIGPKINVYCAQVAPGLSARFTDDHTLLVSQLFY